MLDKTQLLKNLKYFMENSTTTLHTVPFSNLTNWSFQYLIDSEFSYNEDYQLVALGSFLIRNKTAVDIQDDVEYKRVTVSAKNKGITLRDSLKGKKIGTKKQFIIAENQFLLSKIDARNGAFGIVPKEVDGAIITGNFWTYDVDYSVINPIFLSLIVTTPEFIEFCERASNGTTNRHYLQEDLFLAQEIPLPTLAEQNSIVENYISKIKLAEEQEKQAVNLEKEISNYLNKELGIKFQDKKLLKKGNFLQLVHFRDFEKWGFDAQLKTNVTYDNFYPVSKIEQICDLSSGGTPSRSRPEYYKGNIPWIKTGEVINDIILDTEEKITEDAIKNSSAKLYPKGSLIIAMYGQGKTRGRTAKLGIEATTNQACAVLHNINNSIILTDYLWVYLMNEYDRMRELASGNNQPNLNGQMIKNYPVIIPDIQIQGKITRKVFEMKNQIKELNNKAESNRKNALLEFEKEIFSN